ncbi:condensation domain-containing protein, partial [Mucilaginibacter lappiensis]
MHRLTTVQNSIFLTQNIYYKSALFNVGGYAHLKGVLNVGLLTKAIKLVLDRADVIEFGYYAFNDIRIEDNVHFKFYDIVDFFDLLKSEDSIVDWIKNDITKPFNVKENIVKVRLFKSAKDEYFWYTKVHHIIFDGFSMSLFFKTVIQIYECLQKEIDTNLDTKLFPYREFADENYDYVKSEDFLSDRYFWSKKLSTISYSKAFSSSRKLQENITLISKQQRITIPRGLFDDIASFSGEYNSTAFHYFLSSLLVLNRFYDDVLPLIGIPVYNRKSGKHKKTLGLFVNMLPVSFDFEDDVNFIDILLCVKNVLKDCYKHQRFPLIDILEELDIRGNIYDISFSYQKNNYNISTDDFHADITYLPNEQQQESLSFQLLEFDKGGDLALSVDYLEGSFSSDEINRLLFYYNKILNFAVSSPDTGLNKLDLLGSAERLQLLEEFNSTTV